MTFSAPISNSLKNSQPTEFSGQSSEILTTKWNLGKKVGQNYYRLPSNLVFDARRTSYQTEANNTFFQKEYSIECISNNCCELLKIKIAKYLKIFEFSIY